MRSRITSRLRPRRVWIVLLLACVMSQTACSPVSIDVDPTARFQTFEGWRATVEIGDSDLTQDFIPTFREEILDWAVDSLGITQLRLAVKSGYEHPEDLAPAFLADNRRRREWVSRWFTPVNDNADPNLADSTGFQFTFMDHLMETIVLPFAERLEARGEFLHLNLNYVDFGTSPFEHRDQPAEFAEFMLVVVQHLHDKYGIVANSIEILEPDNDAHWTGGDVGRGMVAVGDRLEEAGYSLEFLGPSNITVKGALGYVPEMLAVPGVDRRWKVLSYHRYGDTDPADLVEISRLASMHGMRTAMLEYMYSSTEELVQDLTLANVSSWEKFAILDYVLPDSTGRLAYRGDARMMSQYMRNIRPGAVRVSAMASSESFAPVAFERPSGGYVLLVRVARTGGVSIGGLPAGSYEAFVVPETDADAQEVSLALGDDGRLTGEVRLPGVLVVRPAGGI